jgi:hypothetical protein
MGLKADTRVGRLEMPTRTRRHLPLEAAMLDEIVERHLPGGWAGRRNAAQECIQRVKNNRAVDRILLRTIRHA